ncbi:MAG: hypothetical protein ABR968_08240 [Bacteroidales bacterium]|jgi:hypothetical protein
MKTTSTHFIHQRRKIKLFTLSLLLLIFSGLMLNSCIKKEDFDFNKLSGFEWQPNVAAPIINSRLTLSKILNLYNKKNYIIVDPHTGLLTLVYSQSVYSQRADQLIVIPNQAINTNLSFSLGAILAGDSLSYAGGVNYTFSTSTAGTRLDSIIMKSGYIHYGIVPSISNSKIYINIPQATKNGLPFNRTITSPYPPSDTFNLNGYKFAFLAGNQITINYRVVVYGPAPANNYSVALGESIVSPLYSRIFGYFGQFPVNVSEDSVAIGIFKNKINGSLTFLNPQIKIKSINSIGVPLAILLDTIKAYTITPPASVILSVNVPPPFPSWNVWNISDPVWPNIASISDSFSLDTVNSNVRTLINLSPTYVALKAGALSNPTGNSTIPNFVLDTSRFSIDLQVNLPLFGMGFMTMEDTLKFSFGTTNVSQIQWAKFVISTINGFPLGAIQQIYFADTLKHKLDSLLTTANQQTIVAASVGGPPTYYVTSPSSKTVEITVNQAFLQHVSNVKYLLIYSRLTTTNNGTTPVMIYNTDYMNVKLGMQVQAQTIVYPNHPKH